MFSQEVVVLTKCASMMLNLCRTHLVPLTFSASEMPVSDMRLSLFSPTNTLRFKMSISIGLLSKNVNCNIIRGLFDKKSSSGKQEKTLSPAP